MPSATYLSLTNVNSVSYCDFSASVCTRRTFSWASCCELTETYSPIAIDTVPANIPAKPASKIVPVLLVAPATPKTIPETDKMPSLAPITPARIKLLRCIKLCLSIISLFRIILI